MSHHRITESQRPRLATPFARQIGRHARQAPSNTTLHIASAFCNRNPPARSCQSRAWRWLGQSLLPRHKRPRLSRSLRQMLSVRLSPKRVRQGRRRSPPPVPTPTPSYTAASRNIAVRIHHSPSCCSCIGHEKELVSSSFLMWRRSPLRPRMAKVSLAYPSLVRSAIGVVLLKLGTSASQRTG